jgi:predicted MFS family arabinose efflux permease
MSKTLSERSFILLIGSVQFVNVLDFMMVMPLGPDFAAAFGVQNSRLGLVGASYTLAAAVSGIAGSTFLDRFDRRKALAVALLGLVLSTAASGAISSFETMLVTRCIAGMFGGPASALSLAIVSDVIPPERRGRAMGSVLAAFAFASVLGVPAGLELAHLGGWRLPFFAIALVGACVCLLAIFLLPPLTGHLDRKGPGTTVLELLRRPEVVVALLSNGVVMLGHFALVPNLAAYYQYNFGYPRDGLGLLYFVGGLISIGTMRIAGYLADKIGVSLAATFGTIAYIAVLAVAFISPIYSLPVLLLFAGFMVASSFRAVPMRSLSSRVPSPVERARYMSAQSAVDHLAGAAGAVLGSRLLHELPNGRLEGMDRLGWVTVSLSACVPFLLLFVERTVRRREQSAPALAAQPVTPAPGT